MLSIAEIQSAAEALLKSRFTDTQTVYRDLAPKGFARPSFLVECGPVKMEDAGCGMLDITATVTVTSFLPVDDYHNTQITALQTRMMSVQELFAVGYLEVGGRALHVTGNTGDYGFDFASVTLTLSYADDRPGEEAPDAAMGEVRTTIKIQEV
ncbi:hypothetical protein SDC9_191298 [bioreactor metagenome]|uniref:Uncharacterized protein n=1 Tax=bioreactor metagenome TaxID=1076179 RepID=A0A645HXK6_9ZZZZ